MFSKKKFDSVSLMRFMDVHLGDPLCQLLGLFNRKKQAPKIVRKILLIKFFGFGNIIMVSPAFRELRHRYPDAEIIFLTLKGNKKLVSHYSMINKVIDIDLSNPLLLPFRVLSAIWKLKNENIDITIDFEQYSRTSALIQFLGSRKFGVGFDIGGNSRHALYDTTVPCSEEAHLVLQYQQLLSEINAGRYGVGNTKLEKIRYTNGDMAAVNAALAENKCNEKGKIVVMHVGNGPNAPEKRWAIEKFVELAQRLHKNGIKTAIIGSEADKQEVISFRNAFGDSYIDLFNRLNIPQLAYFLANASAFVSADTGPAHLAAAMNIPSVVLYGPSDPVVYGAWGQNVHHIYKKLDCSPCGSNKNSHEYICTNRIYQKCMKDITVDEVEKKIMEIARAGRFSPTVNEQQ